MSRFPFTEFERLLHDFPDLLRLAMKSGALDVSLNLAKVGFDLGAQGQDWSAEHLNFIVERCRDELSDDALADHGESATAWRAFACLALGYLLGLYQSDQINDSEFAYADAVLPGFMYQESPTIQSVSLE